MMKRFFTLLIIIGLFATNKNFAEPPCHIRHYSTEDGIPQYNIMDMLQDKNGYLWLATWDGLSKFDGYEFKNYKATSANKYFMRSNRIEKLKEDKYGRLWFRSYDGDTHCFDPATEEFWGIQSIENMQHNKITSAIVKPSGKNWLILDVGGCILLKDSTFKIDYFSVKNNKLTSDKINNIFEDKSRNNWILTDNGIVYFSKENKSKFYFNETNNSDKSSKQSFFNGIELNNEIWFGSEKGRIWKINKNNGKNILLQLPLNADIVDFKRISENKVCVFSRNEGFIILNINDNSIKIFNTSTLKGLNSNEITPIHIDKDENLWFETNKIGINRFNLKTLSFKNYNISTVDLMSFVFPPISIVIEDINRKLWVQPRGGGFSLYNKNTDSLEPFFNSPNSNNWLFSNSLHSAYSDKQGILWLSTHTHGLEKIVFDKSYFNTLPVSTQKYPKTVNEVRAVFEDENLNLWVSTKNRKLTIFDKNKNKIGEMGIDGSVGSEKFFPATAYTILLDLEKNIWIGTKGAGIFHFKKTANPLQFSVTQYKHNPSDIYSLSDNSVYSIFQDKDKKIWIGTYGGGLNLIQLSNGKVQFINHRNNLKNYPTVIGSQVRYVTQNKYGNICVGTTSGMLMFASKFSSPENIQFKRYSLEPNNNENSISNNDVHGIYTTKKGEMFIITFGGGINKVTGFDKNGFPSAFKSYTSANGLPSDVTLAIVEDEFGKLWISTENSLVKFNPENSTFKTFSETRKIMMNNYFSEASTCKLRNNDIVFGFSNGLLFFTPKNVTGNNFTPHIAFTNLQIFNKDIEVGTNTPLKKNLNNISTLKLTHKQKYFNIQFAALDYIDPDNIQYAYKLEGFDKDWNYVRNQRIAYYTNIPKGKYTFKVKSTNSDGNWVENERKLSIKVLPSFWESFIAKILYVLLIAGLIYFAIRILLNFYHLKANVELEKKMSDLKLRFFTDISHEIRTPLTMISGPIDYLLQDAKTPENVRHQLHVVSQNSNRMLRLVNQILDLRKIQFTNLKVQEINFANIVSNICDNFTEIAEKQNIQFNIQDNSNNAKIWLDPDSAEKIIINLLSNAFKYTPAGKSINVLISEDEKNVSVEIKDEGVGISKEKQKKLFNRFESFSEDKSKPSTGIGLNMVRELVDKHAAKVTVESEEGKGSTFVVSFRKGLAHFDEKVEIIATGNEINETKQTELAIENKKNYENNADNKTEKTSILVVEDDTDLRQFIRTVLENDYQILEAEDGVEGMKKALKICPDFIISDIMMPHMDGIEFLHTIRKEHSTSHIPVILLTAKSTIETKLEGLEYGADDYITKPFSVNYLKARIANLLEQRKNLQRIYLSGFVPFISEQNIAKNQLKEYQPETIKIASQDDTMMKKVMELIEKNMDNYDFSVEELSKYIGMSRSVFYKKLKSLTGLSPVEFVRDIKMKRAAQLLETGQLMVKEVASMVGILDTRYFARCFKTKFGIIPQEYKNKISENNKKED